MPDADKDSPARPRRIPFPANLTREKHHFARHRRAVERLLCASQIWS
ncbi:hypothetical protein HMPREF1619_01804 [Klebsiella pneumoniae 909957]|nr:hypothetical protein HMPREF1619_01804 [Klebsiella pneumoniae 909957]KXA29031.1 hypothetical protein HMPREF3197_00956 [Klebsiella pneumoniae]